jgi:hypothetical protein
MQRIKALPPQEVFLGLAVGSTVVLVEVFLIALLAD